MTDFDFSVPSDFHWHSYRRISMNFVAKEEIEEIFWTCENAAKNPGKSDPKPKPPRQKPRIAPLQQYEQLEFDLGI
jgi:hypothetical protein